MPDAASTAHPEPSPPAECSPGSVDPGARSDGAGHRGVGPLSLVRRWQCDLCPYATADYADGRCPCERNLSGVEVACTGILTPVPLWCSGCQAPAPSLALTGDATGPLCPDCAVDAGMERTQRIPVVSMFDLVMGEAALCGGGR